MQRNIMQDALVRPAQKKGIIIGYASFFNVIDQQRDQIAKGAFAKTLKTWYLSGKFPKMLWQHDLTQPIGVWTHLREDAKGLYAKGRLALGVAKADEAYLLLKEGALEGLSIGFRTRQAQQDKDRKARILLDIDLVEISLVTFGSNPQARVHHVKAY
ncbi:MAG: HK97 family phage prohead protease [Alphaproteobacteria bacterium]|nr:HK97 family phage prohead protease [Alphaproteobacteria bacterium]